MLLSRLSVTGAQLFATTNPDSPFHWFKQEYLDNVDVKLKRWQFRLSDNPSLSDEYIDALKTEYSGLWYKRYIEGEWVLAEGVVYDMFDESVHVIKAPPAAAKYYVVGVDYGTTNPTVFSLIGINMDVHPNVWLEREHYYCSKTEGRQKTDAEHAEDLAAFISRYNVKAIYLDPSAASFRTECQRQGINQLVDANNNVLDGIRFVSQLLSDGRFKICANCSNAIREMGSYTWDTKASERGEDKPIKAHDHCFSGDTLILTDEGQKPINSIRKGDRVWTRQGWKPVFGTWVSASPKRVQEYSIGGHSFWATPNHQVITIKGKKPLSLLTHSDTLFSVQSITECVQWKKMCETTKIVNIGDGRILKIGAMLNTLGVEEVKDTCTGTYGSTTTGQFLTDTKYTTRTEIHRTTVLKTSNVSQRQSTKKGTKRSPQKSLISLESTVKKFDRSQKNGMEVTKDLRGTENMLSARSEKSRQKHLHVNSVKSPTSLKQLGTPSSAQMRASLHGEGKQDLMTLRGIANCATKNLQQTSTPKHDAVLRSVRLNGVGTMERNEIVYNLTIEDCNEYVANGVLVANCLDSIRYVIFSHLGLEGRLITPEEINTIYQKARGQDSNMPEFFRSGPAWAGGF